MLSLGPVIPKFTQNFDISTKIFRIDPNVPHNFIWQSLNLGCGHVQCWIGRDLGWWESLTVIPARNKANCLLSINHSAKTLYHIINKTEQFLNNMCGLSSVIPYEIMCQIISKLNCFCIDQLEVQSLYFNLVFLFLLFSLLINNDKITSLNRRIKTQFLLLLLVLVLLSSMLKSLFWWKKHQNFRFVTSFLSNCWCSTTS